MDRSERSPNPSELKSLADYLLEKQDSILAQWQDSIKEDNGEQSSALVSLSQDKFINDVPLFLERICDSLRGGESSAEQPARQHGAERWEHGLDLREVTNEWSLLHLILMDQINESQESISISPGSLEEAQRQLARHIHEGMRSSVDEYYRLQRLKAEGQMRDLETVVQEQDKQKEQRGQNLQQASHDLRGSMTAFRMNLNILERTDLSDKARQQVEKLSGAADSLTQLLKDLLDLSRLEAGREELKIEEFDAAELLRGLCENMQSLAEDENLELRTKGDDTLRVQGDRQKVLRIAQNLLLNALKYTQEGYVEISWKTKPEDHWQLSIRDTGPGLDSTNAVYFTSASGSENRPPKTSVSNKNQGSPEVKMHGEGIGLLIVRRLCELLNAILEVESEPESGTVFHIVFPTDYPGE